MAQIDCGVPILARTFGYCFYYVNDVSQAVNCNLFLYAYDFFLFSLSGQI